MSTTDDLTAQIIGRADVNDIEAILAVSNSDRDAAISAVKNNADAIFTWDYEKGARPSLEKLYEKAKVSMWNGETDLPWNTEVDQEAVVIANAEANGAAGMGLVDFDVSGTPFEKWDDAQWMKLGVESQNWTLSQFMHGEQGALHLHRQDRRDRPVDRRQVLRLDAGDGRSPPRRGVREVPRHQAERALPGQRPPQDAARRHRQRLALGHDVPGHAGDGRGPGPRCVRVHPHHDHRAAPEAAAALRHE
ncbi:MAG: hypothetical protein V9E94_06575 [Microthrixaceae bacterium]